MQKMHEHRFELQQSESFARFPECGDESGIDLFRVVCIDGGTIVSVTGVAVDGWSVAGAIRVVTCVGRGP